MCNVYSTAPIFSKIQLNIIAGVLNLEKKMSSWRALYFQTSSLRKVVKYEVNSICVMFDPLVKQRGSKIEVAL